MRPPLERRRPQAPKAPQWQPRRRAHDTPCSGGIRHRGGARQRQFIGLPQADDYNKGDRRRCHIQPRPTNGILVAITVRNWTFASGVTVAMNTTARATFCTSIVGSSMTVPLACGTPRCIRWVISVSALPTSIWPQAMSYLRPSSEVDFVRPVIACLAEV